MGTTLKYLKRGGRRGSTLQHLAALQKVRFHFTEK
jgi:hypothetical protein